jgi:hypothetical protein
MTTANDITRRREGARKILKEHSLPDLHNSSEVIAFHEIFRDEYFKKLIPNGMNIGENIILSVQIVWLDENPNTKYDRDKPNLTTNRDFWQSKDGLALSGKAILRLAGATNANVIPNATGRLAEKRDASGKIISIGYKALMQGINAFGEICYGPGNYEFIFSGSSSDSKRQQYAVQNAETGALTRAFFNLLAITPIVTDDDIGKAFLVPYFRIKLDMDDPKVREGLLDRAAGASNGIYGKDKAPEAKIEEEKTEPVEKPAEMQPPKGKDLSNPQKDLGLPKERQIRGVDTTGTPQADIEKKRSQYKINWEKAPDDVRLKRLKALARMAALEQAKIDKIDGMDKEQQMDWLMRLATKMGEIPAAAVPEKAGAKS